MADPNVGVLVSVGTVIGTVIAFLTFWTRLTDKIAVADQKAEGAQQDAAEAQNDVAKLRDAYDEMTRDIHDQLVRMSREGGENVSAIRQHVTEVAFFGRDNYARKDDIATAMNKIEAVQLAAINEIKTVQVRMTEKLDEIAKEIRDGNGRR